MFVLRFIPVFAPLLYKLEGNLMIARRKLLVLINDERIGEQIKTYFSKSDELVGSNWVAFSCATVYSYLEFKVCYLRKNLKLFSKFHIFKKKNRRSKSNWKLRRLRPTNRPHPFHVNVYLAFLFISFFFFFFHFFFKYNEYDILVKFLYAPVWEQEWWNKLGPVFPSKALAAVLL